MVGERGRALSPAALQTHLRAQVRLSRQNRQRVGEGPRVAPRNLDPGAGKGSIAPGGDHHRQPVHLRGVQRDWRGRVGYGRVDEHVGQPKLLCEAVAAERRQDLDVIDQGELVAGEGDRGGVVAFADDPV